MITEKSPHSFPYNHSPTFQTERLQCAIFFHATGRLRFSRCEIAESGKVRFVFDDPDGIGDQVELEFDRGAPVSASSLFASQKFLRRKMSEILENRRIEKYGYKV
jgi:hypothetical protein